MAFLVPGDTISGAWRSSLELLCSSANVRAYPGPGGELCLELENVVMEVADPTLEPRLPDLYLFPDILKLYRVVVNKKSTAVKTLYDRIYAWGETGVNQLAEVKKRLRANVHSRQGIILMWDPTSDLKSDKPVCPCLLQFLTRDQRLNVTCIVRSSDAWLGAVPDMLTFTELQERLARELRIGVGTYVHHAISYHIYDYHLLQARRLLQE
jgi:thymidylate synthase